MLESDATPLLLSLSLQLSPSSAAQIETDRSFIHQCKQLSAALTQRDDVPKDKFPAKSLARVFRQ
jgi:hypothetical protein